MFYKTFITTINKICYGFGFGLGMAIAFKLIPKNVIYENKNNVNGNDRNVFIRQN